MKEKRLIYLHVPKCAGRTLKTLLFNNYDRHYEVNNMVKFRQWKQPVFKDVDLIFGHIVYCYVKDFDRYKKATILRDPIERTISQYNHFVNMPTKVVDSGEMKEKKITFKKFLETNDINLKLWVNAYCTFFGDEDREQYNIRTFFKRAMDTICNLDFVGIYEQLDETVNRMKKKFGLKGEYSTTGITPAKFKYTLTDDDIEMANKVLKPDINLYKLALQRFEGGN